MARSTYAIRWMLCLSVVMFLASNTVACEGCNDDDSDDGSIPGDGGQVDTGDAVEAGEAGNKDGEAGEAGSKDGEAGEAGNKDGEAEGDSDPPVVPDAAPVVLWDLGKKYGKNLSMGFVGWQDREQWTKIPYGTLPDAVEHDVALEGSSFYFNITWRPDTYISGPVLYRKPQWTDNDAPRHNLLYRLWYTPKGLWGHGINLGWIKVLRNTEDEVLVESAGALERRDVDVQVVAKYGVKRGRPWLEVTPVSQCDEIGMHGESRFSVSPEANPDGSDWVYDSMPVRPLAEQAHLFDVVGGQLFVPKSAKILLDFVMDDDNLWAMMPTPATEDATPGSALPKPYVEHRFFLSLQIHGYHAGWMNIGEEDVCSAEALKACTCTSHDIARCSQDATVCCLEVVSAPYGSFLGRKLAIGHFRPGHWHYQRVRQQVAAGTPFTIAWMYPYERAVKDSPFTPGQPWKPLYPGQWRVNLRIDDKYYTIVWDVSEQDVGKTQASLPIPATGRLEYVLLYLYDRNSDTPKDMYTVMDVYREAILNNDGTPSQ